MAERLLKGPFSVDDYHRMAELGIPPESPRGHRAEPCYRAAHPGPGDILLVIEVADTSGQADRDLKVPLYARAGIPETWLVDLANEVIEVHRQPGLEGYREVHTLRRGDTVSALLLPASAIPVDDVL